MLHSDMGIAFNKSILSPIGSMYGICTYIYLKNQLNVGIHGSYGSPGVFGIFVCREFSRLFPSVSPVFSNNPSLGLEVSGRSSVFFLFQIRNL